MTNAFKFLLGVIILSLFFYISMIHLTGMHELIHKQIYVYYGCEDVKVEFSDFRLSGKTTCTGLDTTIDLKRDMMKLHSMNEIEGYNLTSMFVCGWLMLYFTFLVYSMKD